MSLDPNRENTQYRNPDVHNNATHVRTGSSWVGWVAVIAVILVGAFVWSQMGDSSTDPQTTASTTENSSPAPAPASPATPPAATPAPATPPAGGTGTGGQQ